MFLSFCEAVGFQKKKKKIKKRKKIGTKNILYIIKSICGIFFFFFHLSADVTILTTQIYSH